MPDAAAIFDMLMENSVAKQTFRRTFTTDACINVTRVLYDVYRQLGIAAKAVSVHTRIYSRGFVELAHRQGRMPESREELGEWVSQPGVWSVGIGYGTPDMPEGKWPGHLVLRLGNHMLDATIDQASRPQHGIHLPEMLFVANVPRAFWRADELLGLEVNGCEVVYERRHDNSYMASPAWSGRSDIEGAVTRELLQYIEAKGVPACQ